MKSKIGRWRNMREAHDIINERGKQVCDRFAIGLFPTILLIDRSGVIVYRNEGSGSDEMKKLDSFIRSSLGL
ncbi:hypothetical protein ABIB40_002914 [Pedobacter sp. UYP30]